MNIILRFVIEVENTTAMWLRLYIRVAFLGVLRIRAPLCRVNDRYHRCPVVGVGKGRGIVQVRSRINM